LEEQLLKASFKLLPKFHGRNPYYDEMFDQFSFFDLTKDCCKRSSEIFNELLKKGQIIEKFDCVIAGIYLSNGVSKIITRNKKHFSRISGLGIETY